MELFKTDIYLWYVFLTLTYNNASIYLLWMWIKQGDFTATIIMYVCCQSIIKLLEYVTILLIL